MPRRSFRSPSLYTALAVALGSLASPVVGQTLELREAVDRALAQSLAVQQGLLDVRSAEVGLRQAQLSRYPNLGFTADGGLQFGQTIDPTTNDFVSQQVGTSTFALTGFAPLYQGGRISRSIARAEADIAAQEANLEDIRQDVALTVAQTYLEQLLATEQQRFAAGQLASARESLRQLRSGIRAGARAPVDSFELVSQVARQRQTLQQARNAGALAELRLRQALQADPSEVLNLIDPTLVDFDAVALADVSGPELYSAALGRLPGVRAAELAVEAAELGVAVARSDFLPTVGVFGNLNTRASTLGNKRTIVEDPSLQAQPLMFPQQQLTLGSQTVDLPAQTLVVNTLAPTFATEDVTYFQQLENFFGQSVGVRLSVPIFNNGITRANVERAEVLVERARLATELERQTAEQEVEQAYQAATAGRLEVAAAAQARDAAQAALAAAERRAEVGAGAQADVTNAQLLLEQAQASYLRARYQYLFNVKVVDFYLGRPLEL